MLSDEGMMRAACIIREAAESMSRSAETNNFNTQRLIDNINDCTHSIEKLTLAMVRITPPSDI